MTDQNPKPSQLSAMPETEKTRQERAEDIAYTLNHAISCATTDMLIAPTVSALFGVQVGCSDPSHNHHDHGNAPHEHGHYAHGHARHEHDHHAHKHTVIRKWPIPIPKAEPTPHTHNHTHAPRSRLNWKLYRSEALHYFKGEIIGDLAAVPLTIMTQRFFPSAMEGIRRLAEPIAAPFFRLGAAHAAKRWGAKQGLPEDAPEVVAHAQSMYQHEMQHLPQAVMWNLFAFPIGVVGQKIGGHSSSISRIIRNKSIGALISNGILLGTRAAIPNTAERWDAINSEHVIVPTTKVVGRLVGVKEEEVDRAAKREEFASGGQVWTKRIENDQAVPKTNSIP